MVQRFSYVSAIGRFAFPHTTQSQNIKVRASQRQVTLGIEAAMVIKSRYADPNLPSVDIYTFLFKRKDRKIPDEHRKFHSPLRSLLEFDANLRHPAIFRV
jgi:hypothetical protein